METPMFWIEDDGTYSAEIEGTIITGKSPEKLGDNVKAFIIGYFLDNA